MDNISTPRLNEFEPDDVFSSTPTVVDVENNLTDNLTPCSSIRPALEKGQRLENFLSQ